MPKIFVALTFPHTACDDMERAAKRHVDHDPLARYTRSANLHLTLSYIGEATMEQAYQLAAQLTPLNTLTPREAQTGILQTWGQNLVVEMQPEQPLRDLAKAVRMEIRKLGLEPDPKPFKPHVTLARNFKRRLTNPNFQRFNLALARPVVMVSEHDPKTKTSRYRQVI